MMFRNLRSIAWLMFVVIWLSLLAGSYLFSKKPPSCSVITVVPAVIESSGCYELRHDLELKDPSAIAILIRSNNVRLDLAGHRILGPSSSNGQGVGIAARGIHDVTVENGIITGFLYGIRVEMWKSRMTNRFTLKNVSLVNNGFRAAAIEGNNTVVEDVTVERTGGTLFFPNASAIGLDLAGADCRIRRNQILETYPVGEGEGVGISLSKDVQGCVVEENVLRNITRAGGSKTLGIRWKDSARSATILNNRIDGFTHPLFH
jgi:hypothetical protein